MSLSLELTNLETPVKVAVAVLECAIKFLYGIDSNSFTGRVLMAYDEAISSCLPQEGVLHLDNDKVPTLVNKVIIHS